MLGLLSLCQPTRHTTDVICLLRPKVVMNSAGKGTTALVAWGGGSVRSVCALLRRHDQSQHRSVFARYVCVFQRCVCILKGVQHHVKACCGRWVCRQTSEKG